jgi:hypothetical protein
VIAVAVAGCAVASSAVAAGVQPPVPLHRPMPETPIELAGTDLEPSVRVEIEINARGIPQSVEVRSIDPSTEYDDPIAEAAKRSLMSWRFAPARIDGEPVAETLSWTIRFPSRAEQHRRSHVPELENVRAKRISHDETLARERARLLMLPARERLRRARKLVGQAEELLSKETRRSAVSDHFIVVTDSPQEDAAEILAQYLESSWQATYALLEERLESQPNVGKVYVYVYRSRAAFLEFSRGAYSAEGFVQGFYTPLGLIAFHIELPAWEFLRQVLIHEATHALLDRHIVRPGTALPRWLDEGFAEYMGHSDVEDGTIHPGRQRQWRTRYRMSRGPDGRPVRYHTSSFRDAQRVERKVRDGKALSLERLAEGRLQELDDEQKLLFYGQSWLFVHFLRHGEDSWSDDHFPRFLLYVAEGYPADTAIEEVYGRTIGGLEEDYVEYVKDFDF